MAQLYVAGVPCTGKTSLARYLRDVHRVPAIDMDDEILRVNGGEWPDIETKNTVVKPKVLAEVLEMDDVVLFYSPMDEQGTRRLRDAGFTVVLLDVSPKELRRRDAERQAREGWTNIGWFDHNQEGLATFRSAGLVDVEISGERAIAEIADDILQLRGST